MGGNALNTITERKSTEQFNRIASEIMPILNKELGTDTYIPTCYRTKDSHGDMDILVRVDSNFEKKNIDVVELITKLFEPNDIYYSRSSKNTDKFDKNELVTLSFDYDNFQIDLIFVKDKNWEFATRWFSYDPFPNCAGKVAHQFGLKFSWEGLKLPYRKYDGKLSKNIIITTDHKKAVEFLGFDYDRYEKGFDTLQEIFDYIIGCKYFDSDIFKFENLNHIDRKRNLKRGTYKQFLKYIDDNGIFRRYSFDGDNIKLINKAFPESNLINKLKKFESEYNKDVEIRSKFNGKLVMFKYPFLKGIELGTVMKEFKSSFDNFNDFAMSNTSEQIMKYFDEFIKNYER